MKFTSDEIVKAPLADVFRACTAFETFTRLARNRDISVERTDDLAAPGPGMSWTIGFRLRGRRRTADVRMRRFDAPSGFVAHSRSGGLDAVITLKLSETTPNTTRMVTTINVQAKSVSGKIVMQSLRLVRGRVKRRIARRAAAFARRIEVDWRRQVRRGTG